MNGDNGKDNVIYILSKKLALRIIKLCVYLRDDRHVYVMSKQIFRSGTSIGAQLAESRFAQSDADYISKLSIALKEASETKYWLELLKESEFLSDNEYSSINNDIKTIIVTLVNIVNKAKRKYRLYLFTF